jgi:hypothetical protein
LGAVKLRLQFDQLELKMRRNDGGRLVPFDPAPPPVVRGPDGLTPRESALAAVGGSR